MVLCWNGGDDVLRCLTSLRPQLRAGDAAIVVDNASADGSAAAVAQAHPWAEVIRNEQNRGYAGGNNVGIRAALQRGFGWILLLNQDTIVEAGGLASLLAAADRSGIGAAQPLLLRDGVPPRVDSLGLQPRRSLGAADVGSGLPPPPHADDVEIFGPCGAALLLRASVAAQAGLLDEELFLLLEDLDIAFRIRMTGAAAVLVPAARVWHRRGVSARRTGPAARRRKYWLQRNTVAVALRYWPLRLLLLHAPLLVYRAVSALMLAHTDPERKCWRLWRRFLRERPASRRAMRAHGLDRWFG